MLNYEKAIVDAIPQVELDACMAELAIMYPRLKKVYSLNEDGILMPVLDGNGVQLTEPALDKKGDELPATNGKFMDLTTVEAAFDAIKNLKATTIPVVALVTYKGIAQLSGFDIADQLQTNILSAIAAGDLAQWIDDAFNSDGINVKDSKFRAKIAELSGDHGFTPAFINKIKEIGDVESLDFPKLKSGHVQNALEQRHAGVI